MTDGLSSRVPLADPEDAAAVAISDKNSNDLSNISLPQLSNDSSDLSSRVEFIPILGVNSEKSLCYLLDLEHVRILLDCGWSEDFNTADLEVLRKIAPTIDLVLISFPDIEHFGALPYAVAKLGLKCKICLTRACGEYGILNLYDIFMNMEMNGQYCSAFDLEDLDNLRQQFFEVNFGQWFEIQDLLEQSEAVNLEKDLASASNRARMIKSKVTIGVERAGRIIGGGIWRIKTESEDILYAVDFNHKAERHLDGASFESQKPSILITDAFNYTSIGQSVQDRLHQNQGHAQQLMKGKREDQFLNLVVNKVRQFGNVLIPAGPRAAEILMMLEMGWIMRKLTYNIVFLGPVVKSTSRFWKSSLEFMEHGLNEQFMETRKNPFELNFVHMASDMRQLNQIKDPKVIITSSETLEHGFAKQLFIDYAALPPRKALILFLDKTQSSTSLARKLSLLSQTTTVLPHVKVRIGKWVYNTPAEVEQWRKSEIEKVHAAERQRLQQEQTRMLEAEWLADLGRPMAGSSGSSKKGIKGGFLAVVAKMSKNTASRMFSAAEPERFVEFSEYGQEINEADYEGHDNEKNGHAASKAGLVGEIMSEEDFLDYDFGNLVNDASLPAKFRSRLPRKSIMEDLTLFVKCDVKYIDLEGRSDSRSTRFFIEKMKPKRVILVHAMLSSCQAMKHELEQALPKGHSVIIPSELGVPIDISSKAGRWDLQLDRRLFSQVFNPLFCSSVETRDRTIVAYVEGLITQSQPKAPETTAKIADIADESAEQYESKEDISNASMAPILVPLPAPKLTVFKASAKSIGITEKEMDVWQRLAKRKRERFNLDRSTNKIYLQQGNLSLLDVQKSMEANGVESSFRDGTLDHEQVNISRVKQKLQLIGCLSEAYLKTRDALLKTFLQA